MQRINGDFDDIYADYPECTQFVTSDVNLDIQGSPVAKINATIQKYGTTPNGQQAFLLTVWNTGGPPPVPKSFTIKRGSLVIGTPDKKPKKKTKGAKNG
jgi:hypothetical protein